MARNSYKITFKDAIVYWSNCELDIRDGIPVRVLSGDYFEILRLLYRDIAEFELSCTEYHMLETLDKKYVGMLERLRYLDRENPERFSLIK